ncbi:MAG: aldehyde ferredoxin oxidoreductase family protein [Theionarchaea archaeon]|nr:aldehyde ferredoxin oxidoreductase family protein [Theionarchaea archaeon]MBU7001419.1 aldehyde ferredoxin oxidoreductase family protein [Theionarchaea archaeon]MBU7021880.1 aldehyde ferredoxin oxidoreductase family protein [Theionarchaea archaeon]MBU7034332.1 aldehyde ferredoxin oxidoreductase family protein [Theionarchaea archaeon]MBU7040297.1 aldehyde ferredoxin oxidoreductase family protein [Theionarchaea archaeon]
MKESSERPFQGGYMGHYLDVDLNTESFKIKPLDKEMAEKFVGGRGFTAKIEYDELKPGMDPLSPENVLIFAPGPLTGTGAIGGNRMTVGGKSPLTGLLGDSSVGGKFAVDLKKAGYDYVIIRGKAKAPVVLVIDDGSVQFIEGTEYWGTSTYDTSEDLYSRFGSDRSIVVIGPGGENLVRFACVISIGYNEAPRAAGRTGMGAVMGSKNLKAVVMHGSNRIPVADKKSMKEVIKFNSGIIKEDLQYPVFRKYGTTRFIGVLNRIGCLATRNRQDLVFEHAKDIDGRALREKYYVRDEKCPYCFMDCGVVAQIPSGEFATREVKMEFFPLASLGSNCGNKNLESIVKAKELCDAYGLDIGESGAVIGFAMECYQRGLLTKEDTGGLDLQWDNSPHVIPELLKKIAYREGVGDLMASGVRGLSEKVKNGCERFALQIKGMAMEVMDCRMNSVYNSRQRVASRGADHLRGQGVGADDLEKKPLPEAMSGLLLNETHCALSSMLGLCNFPDVLWSSSREITDKKAKEGRVRALSAVLGVDMTWEELSRKAIRVINLERAVVVREGIRKKDDELPKRFLEDPVPSGPTKGQVCMISDEFIDEYYTQRGWDLETGIPTESTLKNLELDEAAAMVASLGA